MAGPTADSFGNRQLWQVISGTGCLRPQEYIERELNKNKEKLLQGFSFYKKQSTPQGEALKKERKLKATHREFVIRLSQLLGLDELQSHDLFCSFLFTEFRGSQKELTNILTHERHSQTLLLKVVDFYYGERLYILRSLRHILHCWFEGEHAYKDVFAKFLNELLEKSLLGEKLIDQFDAACNAPLPTKELNGPLMGRAQVNAWAMQNLKEQAELLELLVIYYKDFEMDVTTLLKLCVRFKKHGFGWGQDYKHLIDIHMEKLVLRIGFLEILVLLEGLDIMNALTAKEENNLSDHVILCDSANLEKLDKAVSMIGSEPVHSPILLGCAILLYINAEVEQCKEASGAGGESGGTAAKALSRAHIMGNLALQLGVFNVLLDLLETEPFSGKSDLASTAHYCVYSCLSALLAFFQEDSLGNTEIIYKITWKLLKWEFIANMMWEKSGSEGLAMLYDSARNWFPLDFVCFTQLNISLARAGGHSAQQVKKCMHQLGQYTELLDNNRSSDLQTTEEKGVFVLRRNKQPFQNSDFAIERSSKGRVMNPSTVRRDLSSLGHIIQWETTYNGWQMLMGEIQELLSQVSHGAGMVQTEQLIKVTMVMELIKEVMTSDPSSVTEFSEIFSLGYQLILRFAVLSPAPIELLSHTIHCLARAVPLFHTQVSHHLKQTGLLPFLTENIDDFSEVLSGDGVNQGLYGCLLATTECPQGTYLVTLSVLDLVSQLVVSFSKEGREREHTASVLYILREVFPRFHKWRYVDITQRKLIGQKCLQLFHNIFNFVNLQEKPQETGKGKKKAPSLQESCVFSLLFSEAGRSLLDIVTTGVDNIQQTLAQQCSLMEGAGMDLMELVEMSLSLLNRLLLLKPLRLGASPVEQALSSQPAGRQLQHPVATVAQYIYHRHSHRLPALATLLLKRLAMVSPMSILACLGSDAEPIRDMFLTRLQAVSEDVQLKVGILELLSVCVESQPGLIEIFLSVQHQQADAKDLKLGRSSCLPVLLELMSTSKQCTYECPPELLCASLDLVHALWHGMRETPMTVLRNTESFWPSVVAPLTSDLPAVQEDDDLSVQAFKLQTKLAAFSLRIIAMEVYAVSSSKFNDNFKKSMQSAFTSGRLMYWSKAVKEGMEKAGQAQGSTQVTYELTVADHPALNLLLAWKNFLIATSRFKVKEVQPLDRDCGDILHDLLCGVQAQFSSEQLTPVKVKLASISSALYFTLTKLWGKELLDRQLSETAGSPRTISGPAVAVRRLTQVLRESLADSSRLLPSVHIGLLGALTAILQHCGTKLDDLQTLIKSLLPVVCSVFLQSSWQLPGLIETAEVTGEVKETTDTEGTTQPLDSLGSHVKVQIVSCCLLVEILHVSPDLPASLRLIQENGIVSCVLTTMEAFFKARKGVSYIYSSLLLLTKIADTEAGANMLCVSNLTSHLCLALTSCYSGEDAFKPRNLLSKAFVSGSVSGGAGKGGGPDTISWHRLYCLSLDLFSSLLRSLGHGFLQHALDLVGVHQDRLLLALEMARVNLSQPVLAEAESSCNLLLQLCAFQRQWRFYLPEVMAKLLGALMAMLQTYVALLIRPRYLSHILEHKNLSGTGRAEMLVQPSSFLQHQTSMDDVEQPTSQLVEAEHSMLRLVGKALACLKHFTPSLPEIMLDQSLDVTEWDRVLGIGFGTPALESASEGVTFGTLLYCVTVCVRHLAKGEGGKLSPHRSSPDDPTRHQVPRPVIHFALENSLDILMSQACRYLRDPNLVPRDRQFLKRELGTELNSFLSSLHRQLRRGGGVERSTSLTPPNTGFSLSATSSAAAGLSSPAVGTPPVGSASTGHGSLTPQLNRSVSVTSFTGANDPAYIQLVQAFVQKVLR
ncbi:nucleoporin NUP188 homolog [Aplysia californica]|uniref:Nucleoporin NUP188 n=1 Tax=Aplysia californica TaxID=6500 RepID=A0ABM0JS13_APLCA|nr:nucleoporin NUP188 homolog [Aplysia californica]